MADSSRAPLLGDHSGDSDDESGSSQTRVCCFDKIAALFRARNLELASGPLLLIIIYAYSINHNFGDEFSSHEVGLMLGILAWMAVWWMLTPVPNTVTALVPLLLYPMLGLMTANDVASCYMNDVIVLMLGSFIITLAIAKYDLHRRMALKILLVTGGETMNPRLVLLGFLVGPAFVSLWMNNTAVAAMMTPMASGVLNGLQPELYVQSTRSKAAKMEEEGQDGRDGESGVSHDLDDDKLLADAAAAIHKFSQGVILAVIYGTVVGGMGTLIGCGPDLILPGLYNKRFPGAPQVTFLQWIMFGIPLVVLWLPPMWLYLAWCYSPYHSSPMIQASLNRATIEKAYNALGPMKHSEILVFSEFCVIVMLWITRSLGDTPGWGDLLGGYPGNGTVSILGALLLFVVPNGDEPDKMLMDWKSCKDISWNVILLLGGDSNVMLGSGMYQPGLLIGLARFALSNGIQSTGVSSWIGSSLEVFHYIPYVLLAPVIATLVGIITEFSSNVANATLFIPIFAEVAIAIDVHPLLLMIPTALAASYAFILPSGTPPSAIALGSGYLTLPEMVKPGLMMHLVGTIALMAVMPTFGAWVFGTDQPASSLSWLD